MAENRRVKMTKRLIRGAYVDLVMENPDRKPSVTDICDRADVNRSTFYTHYKDLDNLYDEVEAELFSHVPVLVPKSDPDYEEKNRKQLQHFFRCIYDNPRIFSLLVSCNSERNWEHKLAKVMFQQYYEEGVDRDDYLRYYTYVFCIMGALTATKEWHRQDCPIDPDLFGFYTYEYTHHVMTFEPDMSLFKPLEEGE